MSIQARNYRSPGMDYAREAANQGAKSGSDSLATFMRDKAQANYASQQQDKEYQLKQLLLGKQHEMDIDKIKQARDIDLEGAQKMRNLAPEGASYSYGGAHVGQDAMAKFLQGQESKKQAQEAALRSGIIKNYDKDSGGINDHLEAAKGMLNALKTNTTSSPAEVIANFYALHGIKRFSPSESHRIAPEGMEEKMSKAIQSVGLDPSRLMGGDYLGKGFNDVEKSNFAKLGNDQISSIRDRVKQSQDKALNDYQANAYQSPTGLNAIQHRLSQDPYSQSLDELQKGYGSMITPPQQRGPSSTSPQTQLPSMDAINAERARRKALRGQ